MLGPLTNRLGLNLDSSPICPTAAALRPPAVCFLSAWAAMRLFMSARLALFISKNCPSLAKPERQSNRPGGVCEWCNLRTTQADTQVEGSNTSPCCVCQQMNTIEHCSLLTADGTWDKSCVDGLCTYQAFYRICCKQAGKKLTLLSGLDKQLLQMLGGLDTSMPNVRV